MGLLTFLYVYAQFHNSPLMQIGALANAAGVGGGAIYIPMFHVIVGFGELNCVPSHRSESEGLPHLLTIQ